jgi:ribosomal-protein-alanine N-acetyltransferase
MLQFNFSPFPTIDTERLHLRRTTLQDDEAMMQLRIDDAANKYLDRARPTHLSEMHELVKKIDDGIDNNTAISWTITLKEQPEKLIGNISFHKTDAAHHRAEIGYMLMPEHWRKGLVSEAIKAVIAYGFNAMNLHSIEANINPRNEPSRNILLKHGFVKEAYFKESYHYNGKFLDSEIYSLLKSNE